METAPNHDQGRLVAIDLRKHDIERPPYTQRLYLCFA
jgi:hypothetical protein